MSRLTLDDLRKQRICTDGARRFCLRHGFSFREFARNGVDLSEIEHIDDALLKAVLERKKNDG